MLFLFSEIAENYLKEIKSVRKNQTYEFYLDLYQAIAPYIKSRIKYINDLTKDIVLDYIEYMKSRDNSNNTINKRIMFIKQIIKYAESDYSISSSEFVKILAMKKLTEIENHVRMLNNKELEIYKKYVLSSSTTTFIDMRDKICLYLLLSSGIRLNELLNLKMQNIDYYNALIKLDITKTNQVRYLPIDDYLLNLLYIYRNKYHTTYLMQSTKTNSCFTLDGLNKYLHKLFVNKIGLNISSRVLRHTFCTVSLRNNAPIDDVRQIMGHKDISTTQIYIHTDIEIIQKNFKKFNPLCYTG